jgi:hypothetical protein
MKLFFFSSFGMLPGKCVPDIGFAGRGGRGGCGGKQYEAGLHSSVLVRISALEQVGRQLHVHIRIKEGRKEATRLKS